MLSFTLLGQTVLSKNGVSSIQFRSQKEVALLVYLAQTQQAHPRDFLAELLWESRTTKQSLTNLRTVLARLRKQVGEALLTTRKSVSLTPENQQQVDSVLLLQALADAGAINAGAIDAGEKAASLQTTLERYHGDFLADFYLSDAPQFNEWVIETREKIRRQVVAAYDQLAQYFLSTKKIDYGLVVARRWLDVDALDEMAHTLLIRLLLEAGKEREALAHYEYCVNLLRTEMDIAPPAKMSALIAEVHTKNTSIPPAKTAVPHNLAPVYNQFFGRQAAQQEIHIRLDQPWCRLVTITGQGGVGKTRLATLIAHSRLSQYQDGVWLIELENIDPADDDLAEAIAVEIATILDMRLTGSATPVAQLLNHLQHKQMMLVLDNFEHLLEGIQIVLDIVQQCEHVQLIVTSREALRIQAEWTIALTGLGYPTNSTDEMPSDAVALFAARQAQQRRGAMSPEELTAVRQICQLVEGLPLAIELAAALTRHSTCQAVADNLRKGFDALATSLRDVPQRHRSLQIVFEMSWQVLTPDLQQQLAQLSVFRGGFTETAVTQITHAPPHHLAELSNKSLLTYHAESARYTLHPVIRAYAAEKLSADDPTPHKHAHYYLTLLAQHTDSLQKETPQESIIVLEPDIDNIRRAWQMSLSAQNATLLTNALPSLSMYYQLHGLAHEGEHIMHNTMSAARTWGSDGIPVATHAGLERARFQNRLGQYQPAIQTIQTALKLADQCADRWAKGMGHVWWGESLWRLGKHDAAKEKLTDALDIGHSLDALLIIGWCHHQLGIIHDIQSRYEDAHDHLEKACAAWQELHHERNLSVSLNSIGLVYRNQGNFSAAKQATEQALAICIQQGNHYLEAMLLNNLSSLLINHGDYFGAQYYLQLGLELAKSNGSLASQGDIYLNMGENYRLQEAHELAIQNFEAGLKIAKMIGNRPSIAEAFCKLADLERMQGKITAAEKLYSQALAITRRDNLKSLECEALIGLTKLYIDIDSVKAKKYTLEVTTLAKTIGQPNLLKRVETINRDISLK